MPDLDTHPNAVAERYLALWNEADDTRRRDLLTHSWAPDATYVDPLMDGATHEGIAAMIEAARGQFPGHGFTLRGTPDGHGPYVRFAWTLAPDGGAPIAEGTDVVRLDAAGRIAEVVGFLDGAVQ